MKKLVTIGCTILCIAFFVTASVERKNNIASSLPTTVLPPSNDDPEQRVPAGCKYTPYQILVWEIKANEGYVPWWYRDGWGANGRPAYSIGFGWNDLGGTRRGEIRQYTKDGVVTMQEATEIMLKELEKYGDYKPDALRNIAVKLHRYNTGQSAFGSDLGSCCGGQSGCGRPVKPIRDSHNRRRKFELALWKHNVSEINRITEENKEKVSKMKTK